MSEYFLKLPGDSQPRAYSEYEVREFLGQGVIDSTTLTWKQGMDGWQPVDQVLPSMSPVRACQIIHPGVLRAAAFHALEQLDCFLQQRHQL